MKPSLIDARDERGALRRAAVLLERVRQDGGVDPDLDALSAGVSAIRRLAADGRPIHRSTIERLDEVLARIAPAAASPLDGTVHELLRWNALVETKELLQRLGRARLRARHASICRTNL